MKDFFCNNSAFEKIKKDLNGNKLTHAYLFLSDDLLTNIEFTKYVAKFILCSTHTNCDICENCAKVNKDSHPDLLTFPKEKNIVVEDTEKIIEETTKSKMFADYKIFILNDFSSATQQAQNKLLKILEEPPKNVVFLLNSTNKNKVLQTILSRVKQIEIEPLKREDLKRELEKIASSEALEIALDFGDGWLGKTTSLAKDKTFVETYNQTLEIITKMKTSKQVIYHSTRLASSKDTFIFKLEILASFFRKILLYKQTDCEISDELKAVSNEYSVKALTKIFEELNKAKKRKEYNVNINLIADNLLMKILEDKYLWK